VDALDDAGVSHFIPSVQLTGSRDEKLRKLDTFIHHLLVLRDVLSGATAAKPVVAQCYGRFSRPWCVLTAGLVTGATLALALEAAIRWLL
jgi:hypothetical protein